MKSREYIEHIYKWDFSNIFRNHEEIEKAIEAIKNDLEEIKSFEGTLSANSNMIKSLFIKLEETNKKFENLYFYIMATNHTDMLDNNINKKVQEINILANEFSIKTSYINPEILGIGKELVYSIFEKDEFLKNYLYPISKLFKNAEHTLNKDKEELLSYFSQTLGAFDEVYNNLTVADVSYPEVQLDSGEKIVVTGENLSSLLKKLENQKDREKVFTEFFDIYKKKENSFASIYNGIVQRNLAESKARNYNNILESFLKGNNISNEVFENLIFTTKNMTEPLKKYINLRKEKLSLEEYHTFDRFLPLAESNKKYNYEEGKILVKQAIAVMGEDYINNFDYLLEKGAVDVYASKGKRGGAYSWGTYGTRPYILLNYNDELNDVFTLAHEMGHSMHSLYSNKTQPYATHDYTIFVAEVASTFNEHLLLDYLLKTVEDKNERIYILQQAIDGLIATFYRQTLFAEYEYKVHKMAEEGKPITAEILNQIMENLYLDYYGIDIKKEYNKHSVWARIPHFFNSPFYVYQYATSYAASSKLFNDLVGSNYSKEKIENIISLLKSGGNNDPILQLKKAGADLEDKNTVEAVSRKLALMVEELEKALN